MKTEQGIRTDEHPVLGTPWRRPGRLAYARRRLHAALRPPVTVTAAPADLVEERDVPVVMRDGVTLRVNVYRPAGTGPFPVLLSEHPYGKDKLPRRRGRGWKLSLQYHVMNQPEPIEISDRTGWEAPDPAWWTRHGYTVINADARGAGTSDGVGDLLSDSEARDIADLIAWAAAQPWSTGRVGMLGVSYLAISQYKAAALNPPALKAICPWEGFTDAYGDFFTPGGVPERGFSRIWLTLTRRAARMHVDIAAGRPRHPLRDDWWAQFTPDLTQITVPMLECVSFSDAELHSVGSLRAFEQAGSAEKFAYMHRGPKWSTFYGAEAKAAQLAFFDRFLRERDVPAPPRARLEVRERGDRIACVRDEQQFPPARTQWRELFLSGDGCLAEAPAPSPGSIGFSLRRQAAAFTVTFAEDTEVTGVISVRLWVSVTTSDANLFVGVEKRSGGTWVPFEGSYGYGRDRVAVGRQRLSLGGASTGSDAASGAGTDAAAGTEADAASDARTAAAASVPPPEEPSFAVRRPVAPGQVVQVEIPLSPSATLFRAGESLRLLVAGRVLHPRNPLFGHFPALYEPSPRGLATLHWGPERRACLRVPVVPAA